MRCVFSQALGFSPRLQDQSVYLIWTGLRCERNSLQLTANGVDAHRIIHSRSMVVHLSVCSAVCHRLLVSGCLAVFPCGCSLVSCWGSWTATLAFCSCINRDTRELRQHIRFLCVITCATHCTIFNNKHCAKVYCTIFCILHCFIAYCIILYCIVFHCMTSLHGIVMYYIVFVCFLLYFIAL